MPDIEVDYCVVGAGFAGLTAALRLKQAGQSVALVEARDRIGGRTFTVVREDGSWIDRGGAWIGPGQDRIYALMDEFGVKSYKQYTDGEAMMVVDGKQYRYKGTIPLTMSPWAAANLGAVFVELGEMCKTIPLEAPWEAKKAAKWDAISLAKWLGDNTLSKPAHDLLETAIAGCYTSAASEVSMLFVLYQMASGGGPSFVLGVKDAAEDARPVGGMGAVYRPMAAAIGDALHLSQPVRDIAQDGDGVTVRSADMAVRARRAIVAVPHRDREPDPLRAAAADGSVLPAPADAERRGHEDRRPLRRTLLARGRIVRAVRGTRLPPRRSPSTRAPTRDVPVFCA